MGFIISFLSGVVAAFTPCVIVLMPMLLYRFFHDDTRKWFDFGLFVSGFLVFYVIFGYFLSALFTSFIQNGLKFGLGLLFVILGILAVFNRLNPMNFPFIKNSILFGAMFALIVSFNPCTIPYLSVIVSINNTFLLFLNLIVFGLGLIVPAILFAFFGQKILTIGKKSGKLFYKIGHLMHYVLIVSGIYLIFTIRSLGIYDIYVVSLFLAVIFFILLKSFFIIGKYNKNFSFRNILIFLALLIMLLGAYGQCKNVVETQDKYSFVYGNENNHTYSCSQNIGDCEVCRKCIYTFLGASLIGFLGIFLIHLKKKK